ncbi:putative membrane protein [Rhodococcus sp. PvR044]|jgi:uncharacterized membrane protein|uniref:hypothetical protein n=1 Tax=Rhodococcus TaxID=1827 RepID=UPI000BD1455F|nr:MULTISPECIES: hypothetical protein [Rhodococcus]MBP1162041.1 putative membrane protein [Rhodococcus sp. PvR099]MCZ4557797.1 hypothetical protein [Rhodococcus maanshanensis]PTR43249.1 putative membrane protein [Rhodococcus sp. OK611]SNX91112.1 Uncharacterized membrane protein [Rhodococcus sp. OK270]
MSDDPHTPSGSESRAERRWTASAFVLVAMAVPFLLPSRYSPGTDWVLPAIEGFVLLTLIVVDPGRIDRPGRWVRALSIALVVAIAAGAAWGSARLVWDLLHGAPQTTVATELLISGALVWSQTVLAFGFLYWELDGGGPVNRHLQPPTHPDLAFPQQLDPGLAAPGWRPVFVDYLYLALTNATAFSPTDVMPLARWAKLTMSVQSILSIVILSLVVANAVNLLG